MKFDKATVKLMRTEIENALRAVAEKYDLQMDMGRITFSATEFRGKLSVRVKQPGEASNPVASNPYSKYLTPDRYPELSLGMKVVVSGAEYTVVGARPRAKLDIVLRKGNNKMLTAMSVTAIRFALKNNR